jgi:acetyl-CoA C-acetyltransferase
MSSGTTSEQLAEIRSAASSHAKHNPNAFIRDEVSVTDVIESPLVVDPLHRLDCRVITDGGGALVVVSPDVARDLDRMCVKVLGGARRSSTARTGASTSRTRQPCGPVRAPSTRPA